MTHPFATLTRHTHWEHTAAQSLNFDAPHPTAAAEVAATRTVSQLAQHTAHITRQPRTGTVPTALLRPINQLHHDAALTACLDHILAPVDGSAPATNPW